MIHAPLGQIVCSSRRDRVSLTLRRSWIVDDGMRRGQPGLWVPEFLTLHLPRIDPPCRRSIPLHLCVDTTVLSRQGAKGHDKIS